MASCALVGNSLGNRRNLLFAVVDGHALDSPSAKR